MTKEALQGRRERTSFSKKASRTIRYSNGKKNKIVCTLIAQHN